MTKTAVMEKTFSLSKDQVHQVILTADQAVDAGRDRQEVLIYHPGTKLLAARIVVVAALRQYLSVVVILAGTEARQRYKILLQDYRRAKVKRYLKTVRIPHLEEEDYGGERGCNNADQLRASASA